MNEREEAAVEALVEADRLEEAGQWEEAQGLRLGVLLGGRRAGPAQVGREIEVIAIPSWEVNGGVNLRVIRHRPGADWDCVLWEWRKRVGVWDAMHECPGGRCQWTLVRRGPPRWLREAVDQVVSEAWEAKRGEGG